MIAFPKTRICYHPIHDILGKRSKHWNSRFIHKNQQYQYLRIKSDICDYKTKMQKMLRRRQRNSANNWTLWKGISSYMWHTYL